MVRAENLYQLALNFSNLQHVTHDKSNKYLQLPVIIINEIPADYKQFDTIKMGEIENYSFEDGPTASINGAMGQAGILKLERKK